MQCKCRTSVQFLFAARDRHRAATLAPVAEWPSRSSHHLCDRPRRGRPGVELLVIRHGIAHDAAPGGRDADRALTREGRTRMEQVARGLLRLDLRVDRLLHSPWRRAVETAEQL